MATTSVKDNRRDEAIKNDIVKALRHGKEIGEIISHVAYTYGLTRNAAQKRIARVRADLGIVTNNKAIVKTETPAPPKVGEVQVFETNYDGRTGQTTYSGMVAMKPNQNCDPEYILRQYGLDPYRWSVCRFTKGLWDVAQKKGGPIQCHSFKLSVMPRDPNEYTPEEVCQIIAEAAGETLATCNKALKEIAANAFRVHGDDDGVCVTVHLPDIHVGLLACAEETGENYDIDIACKQVMNAINKICEKLKNMKIKRIFIISQGDFIHIDSDAQTTSHGTFQQTDGPLWHIFKSAYHLQAKIITTMATLAPVHYVFEPGNHDKNTGWFLAFAISEVFKNVPGVTCDCSPEFAKLLIFGQAALVTAHGDGSKSQVDSLVATMLRTKRDVAVDYMHNNPDPVQHVRSHYLKLGHTHNANSHTTKDGSCHVEYLDSVCAASSWEHSQGYASTPERYISAFVWDGSAVPPDRIIGSISN